MSLPSSLTTVTPFSKLMALILFILLPLAGFWMGMAYQKSVSPQPACHRCGQGLIPTPTIRSGNSDSEQTFCERQGGIWRSEFSECEGINQNQCTSAGGVFDECASACRHDPSAEFCIEICVPVCSF